MINWKDILERMLKTFVQGVLSYLVIAMNGITNTDDIVVKSLLLGCVASGLSAIMNLILQEMEMKKNE